MPLGPPGEPCEVATYRAIEATCDAVVGLLRDNYPADLTEPPLQFAVFTKTEFATGLGAGVSLFLYRVHLDGTERAPEGRAGTRWSDSSFAATTDFSCVICSIILDWPSRNISKLAARNC